MPLLSPRFRTNATLQRVLTNQLTLKRGSTGNAVHLVQMSFMDLGFAMPNSTGNPQYSPDGVFGPETERIVKQFQADSGTLMVDGLIGPMTIQALDSRVRSFTHRVRLHIRSLAVTDVPFERSLANAQTVYGQYAIKIEFASGESILLTPQQRQLFDKVDQECRWELTPGELQQVQTLGSPAPVNEILVFHVNRFSDNRVLGCGGHTKNRPACTIAARAGAWDMAHEVGHVLLGLGFSPEHISDRRNLMHTQEKFSSVPVLTDRQVARIRASICCQRV